VLKNDTWLKFIDTPEKEGNTIKPVSIPFSTKSSGIDKVDDLIFGRKSK